MTPNSAYVMGKSEKGFNRYVREYLRDFREDPRRYRFIGKFTLDSFEDKIEKEKYTLLTNEFLSLLTEQELEAINYLEWHHKDENEPQYYRKAISSAYEKWLMIFFNKNNTIYKEISPVLLGKTIDYLIKNSRTNKTEFASMIGVNRSTITAIVEGKRMPSVEVIYKVSIIFKISIDELISFCLI